MPLVIWSCLMCFTTSNWAALCLGMIWSAIFFSSELNFLNRSSNSRDRSLRNTETKCDSLKWDPTKTKAIYYLANSTLLHIFTIQLLTTEMITSTEKRKEKKRTANGWLHLQSFESQVSSFPDNLFLLTLSGSSPPSLHLLIPDLINRCFHALINLTRPLILRFSSIEAPPLLLHICIRENKHPHWKLIKKLSFRSPARPISWISGKCKWGERRLEVLERVYVHVKPRWKGSCHSLTLHRSHTNVSKRIHT